VELTLKDLIPVLQVAIGPVILISGVGLLLLTMSNRFGRIIDRSRILSLDLQNSDTNLRNRALAQVQILSKRARLVRRAITLAAISVLLAAILIIVLFILELLRIEAAWLLIVIFAGSMTALIASLIAFIQDINLSLIALKLELGEKTEVEF